MTAGILSCLEEGPRNLRQLTALLASESGLGDKFDWSAELNSALEQLLVADLIASNIKCPCP